MNANSRLCIDPGHGMGNVSSRVYDPGAHNGGVDEADVVLLVALALKWVLAQAGLKVWLTRDDDRDADPVSTRARRAAEAGCTHLLSLHCNAGGGSGVETYYRDANDRAFAAIVHAAALEATGLPDRGIKPEWQSQHPRLAVLAFRGPACLVELGFLDNDRDRKVLLSREVRLAFARGLARRLAGG